MDRPRGADDSTVGWRRLWDGVRPHAVDPGSLGEYAVLLQRAGAVVAQRAYPAVATHLARGCETCEGDLRDLVGLIHRGEGVGASRNRPARTGPSPYFHSLDVTQTMDALLGASDTLVRLRSELVQALDQVRRLQSEAEQRLQGAVAHVLGQPDRIRDMEQEIGQCIGSVENFVTRLMTEVDELVARYEQPPGEGMRDASSPED